MQYIYIARGGIRMSHKCKKWHERQTGSASVQAKNLKVVAPVILINGIEICDELWTVIPYEAKEKVSKERQNHEKTEYPSGMVSVSIAKHLSSANCQRVLRYKGKSKQPVWRIFALVKVHASRATSMVQGAAGEGWHQILIWVMCGFKCVCLVAKSVLKKCCLGGFNKILCLPSACG